MDRITICSRIDAKIFKDFAYFDTMKLQKRWKQPAIFAAILLFSAAICFSQVSKREGAFLLGTALSLIAIGFPFSYIHNFNVSLNKQVIKQGITSPKEVYSIELNDKGVIVSNKTEKADFDWSGIYRVYYHNNCVYLYVAAGRAFLLPENEIKCGVDTLWKMLEKHLPAEKLFR